MKGYLISGILACSRLRRSPHLVDDVKQCAKRIVSHHQRDLWCGEAAPAPGERRWERWESDSPWGRSAV